jgi:hypothetical protein
MIANSMNADYDMRGQSFDQLAFKKGDHRGNHRSGVAAAKAKVWMSVRALLLWLALLQLAPAAEPQPEDAWRIWFESKAVHAPVETTIPDAQRTVWVAGFLGEDGLTPFSKEEYAALKVSAQTFALRAQANAAADLKTLKPEFVRNRNKVIEYAEFHSDRPIVASAVLAAGFLNLFKDTLGEKVLLIVPNRFTAYVFPSLASNFQNYSQMIISAFHETAYPVSEEVFELSALGVRTEGLLEEP